VAGASSVVTPLPGWLRRAVAYGLAVIVLTILAWLVVVALLRIGLVAFSLLAAVLLTALLAPPAHRLRESGLPKALAALVSLTLLVGVPVGVGYLIYTQVMRQVADIGPAVSEGTQQVRDWLVQGPLALDPSRIDNLLASASTGATQALPSPVAGTATAVSALTGVALVLFTVFFLVKDGDLIWRWVLGWMPLDHRESVDGGGRVAWATITAYVRGTALVALADAVGIGLGLLVLGVPLWLSLTLLTFIGAFVPIIGATLAGGAAVLVTLVTNGPTHALIVLGVVLVVQQLESNLLQPLIMSGVVKLHPLAIVTAVACGTLLLGIAGAVLAVPVVAVIYRVVSFLSGHDAAVAAEEAEDAAAAEDARAAADGEGGWGRRGPRGRWGRRSHRAGRGSRDGR
jgi:predicted PurR-regulated permease PerM